MFDSQHSKTLSCDSLEQGEFLRVPIYDMAKNKRVGYENIPVKPAVIIEGVYAIRSVVSKEALFVYLDAETDTLLARKLHRDVSERKIDEKTVRERFSRNVLPAIEKYRCIRDFPYRSLI